MNKFIILLLILMIISCTKENPPVPNNTFCTQEYNPVCGTNGKTYSNSCMAGENQIVHEGTC